MCYAYGAMMHGRGDCEGTTGLGVSQIILGLSDRGSLNPLTPAFLVLAAELTSNEDFSNASLPDTTEPTVASFPGSRAGESKH